MSQPKILKPLKTSARPVIAMLTSNHRQLQMVQPLSLLKQPLHTDDGLYYDAVIKQVHHDYTHTEAKIYYIDGNLLAISRRIIAVYN